VFLGIFGVSLFLGSISIVIPILIAAAGIYPIAMEMHKNKQLGSH
jgi:hypothetical protein